MALGCGMRLMPSSGFGGMGTVIFMAPQRCCGKERVPVKLQFMPTRQRWTFSPCWLVLALPSCVSALRLSDQRTAYTYNALWTECMCLGRLFRCKQIIITFHQFLHIPVKRLQLSRPGHCTRLCFHSRDAPVSEKQ